MAEEEKKATTTSTTTTKFSASLSAVEGEADDGWGSEGDWGDE